MNICMHICLIKITVWQKIIKIKEIDINIKIIRMEGHIKKRAVTNL